MVTKALDVSRVVNVQVYLGARPAPLRNFGAGLLVGATDGVIDVNERIREYNDLDEVTDDFATTTPEYAGADLHFSQSPQPDLLYIGRFAQTATRAILKGVTLTPTQQLLANFTAVNNGAFEIQVNGDSTSVTGLNFTGATTLPGVAYIVQQALGGLATCVWNDNYDRFEVYSVATGTTATMSYAKPPTATGAIVFSAQPAVNSTVTLNGTVVTFVASAPTSSQVLIGASLAATLQNLVNFIAASTDAQIVKFVAGTFGGNTLDLQAAAAGTGGNALTIAASTSPASNGVVSGATLSGGTGTDVTGVLGLSQAAGALVPVQGAAAETPLACVAALIDISNDWYALEFALASPILTSDRTAIAQLIEGSSPSRIYGTSISTTDVETPGVTTDVASIMKSLTLKRTFCHFSSSTPHSAVSLFARASTVNYEATGSVITLKFKQEPGIVAERLTASQATALDSKNCNYFAAYNNGTAIVQQGVMANGDFIDERIGIDWFQNALQTALYNLLLLYPKIPQTNAGMRQLVNEANTVGERGVRNGLLAGGKWNGISFGNLANGDILTNGYYFWCDDVNNQNLSDRAARKSMPLIGAAKFAGAVHSIDATIYFDR